jgi:flagellar biosynthetic protein FliO
MVGFDRKTLILLAIAALSSSALAVGSAQPGANEPASKETAPGQKQPPPQTAVPINSLFANDPNFQGESDYTLGHQELFYRTMIAVVFVIVLGAAAIYVSKRLLPKIARLPGKEIRIVETVHLGPRRAVHLLEIGDRRLLIGSTNENITKLADLTAGFKNVPAQEID